MRAQGRKALINGDRYFGQRQNYSVKQIDRNKIKKSSQLDARQGVI
jgi:hypothetical protein